MKKQAWIGFSSDNDSAYNESGFCDLDQTLSLFEAFNRYNRASCPTLQELDAEGTGAEPFEHAHVDFDVCFGLKAQGDQGRSTCYLSVSALKPTGYAIMLTVPRYFMGCIPIPRGMIIPRSCQQYYAKKGTVLSREHVIQIIQALFLKHGKELVGWAQSLPYLERTY